MLDVDHFKTLNDTHGHPAGDLALRMISRAVIAGCRTTDVAVRYGGEEIMVVLPGTAGSGAVVVAERMRKSIEELELEYEGAQIRCTGSIGVAWSGPDSIDFASLVRRADEALFEAKGRGRNTVCQAADPVAAA
jgi:diguanylate cyclase (GGDEF)-like protein